MKKLFQFRTDEKPTDENIMRLILPSILGIILCMVCLCGTTWAWFSGVMVTGKITVQAANYAAQVEVTDDSGQKVEKNADGNYPLSAEKTYTVILTIGGTAEKTVGYCKVTLPDGVYYTGPMCAGDTVTFSITGTEGNLSVLGLWGTYSGNPTIEESCTLTGSAGQNPPESTDPAADTTVPSDTSAELDSSAADTAAAEPAGGSSVQETTTPIGTTETTAASEETTGQDTEPVQVQTGGEE